MKKEIEIAKQGVQLADEIISLAEKGVGGGATPNDYPLLKDCFEKNPFSEQLLTALAEEELIRGEKKNDLHRLVAALRKKESQRHRRRVALRFAAAAAILVISFSLWSIVDKQEKEVKLVATTLQKPILILENGKNIDLTDENEVIQNQNYTIRRSNNNQLTYSTIETLSGDRGEYNTIVVPCHYTYRVVLADGSEVHLNANSELRYPVKFSDTKREVFLKGEGYFVVAKSEIPFVVATEEVDVKVYGTIFNINLHKKGVVEAVLISGSVGVETKNLDNNCEVRMVPSQKFSLNIDNKKFVLKDVDPENESAWTQNYFKCNETALDQFLSGIENWYGVQFKFRNDQDRSICATIALSRNLPLDDILSILESTLNIVFVRTQKDEYEIKSL